MTVPRPWGVLWCGLVLALFTGVSALTGGLFLQWSAAFYLPLTLAIGIPMAVLTAVAVACGGRPMAGWLMLLAWGVASLAAGSAQGAFVALWGTAGIVLAVAVQDQWWYGRTVAAMAAVLLALAGLHLVLYREEFGQVARSLFSWWVVAFQQMATVQPDAEAKQKLNVLSELFRTTQKHWAAIGPGICIAFIVEAVAVLAMLATYGVRLVTGRPAFRGSFREMRPPDSLVWLGILFVLLGVVDWRWDVPMLRLVSWNGGIGLSAVYFLNGLSVLLATLRVLGPPILAPVALIVVFLMSAQVYPMLCFVGLFDTWAEFRGRLDRWVARAQESTDEDKDG